MKKTIITILAVCLTMAVSLAGEFTQKTILANTPMPTPRVNHMLL